jgi:hypothetical protein
MAWEDLEEDIGELFGHRELGHVPDGYSFRNARKHTQWKDMSPAERRSQYVAHLRYMRRVLTARRDAKHAALGATTCIRPGCCNLLPPPGSLRHGKVSTTCEHRCSNAVAYYRRTGKLAAQRALWVSPCAILCA